MLDFLLSYQIVVTWFKVQQPKSHYGLWEVTTQDLMDLIAKITKKTSLAAKGTVMATSSKVPEASWCGIPQGGLYTCDFIFKL